MLDKTVAVIETEGAYDLAATFSLVRTGSGDPCLRVDTPHQLRMAWDTRRGPAAVTILQRGTKLHTTTEGPGAEWLSAHLASLLGVDYRPPTLDHPRKLQDIANTFRGMRLPRFPSVSLRLVQIILQQMVSFRDACTGWRSLVKRFGTPVPQHDDLWFPPSPERLKDVASYQYVECSILPRHGRSIGSVMRQSASLERTWAAGHAPLAVERTCQLLGRIRGIGPWTIGFLRGAGLGDADAVVLGDYSHPRHVSHFFTDQEHADDERMIDLLEPFRPHRFYVLALLVQGAPRPPRRGPRGRSLRNRLHAGISIDRSRKR